MLDEEHDGVEFSEVTEGSRCTCYVENCKTHLDRLRKPITAVVDCEKHSTPGLRQLQARGREFMRDSR